MKRLALAAVAAVVGVTALPLVVLAGVITGPGQQSPPSNQAVATIPSDWLALYQQASAVCPGLSWAVVAAIGTVESSNGQSAAPGVRSGSNSAGAEGPMQFEPATFRAYATIGPGGAEPASPYDPVDAVYSAVKMLCVNGGASPSTLQQAVYAYNHSDAYVSEVLSLASRFQESQTTAGKAGAAVAFAEAAIGTPYVWGGTGNGGFDCSGLVQAAYRTAGIGLPRVAQDQLGAGPPVSASSPLLLGDLVFFGASARRVTHVGIYIDGGQMVDAPHTGALVRVESVHWNDFVGATRPAGKSGLGSGGPS